MGTRRDSSSLTASPMAHRYMVRCDAVRMRMGVLVAVAIGVAGACGGSAPTAVIVESTTSVSLTTVAPVASVPTESVPATSALVTPTTVATTAPTTVASTVPSTVPPTTADTTTTTTPLSTETLVLAAAAVGPFAFGSAIIPVLDALLPVLGPVLSDTAHTYPVMVDNRFIDEFGDFSFAYPYGRQTCFENEFCVVAGGPTPGELVLVGWSQADAPGALATDTGIAVGLTAADVGTIDIVSGCYAFAVGVLDGIEVDVYSAGEPFWSVDEATDTYVEGSPELSDITIVQMAAGDNRVFEYDDC